VRVSGGKPLDIFSNNRTTLSNHPEASRLLSGENATLEDPQPAFLVSGYLSARDPVPQVDDVSDAEWARRLPSGETATVSDQPRRR
jgi:hypothetical protein